ncbi:Ribosome-releasing factor 2, mitochondrial [Psilocybe cubensis]|uniref:Tr-type G domain-containing protein n=2 Tax=Psilocybe cubensis TaxID=181762 RepID=A0A8H7Y187_PSICU|nr:Ribosome-releasing factor 2, mitochondrial [Psilocybe cubensis]KAH9482567.1 Ribosome-releasing factor 2, mitochondrial [Psilocybe cubensis]
MVLRCHLQGIRQAIIYCVHRQYATTSVQHPSKLRNMALVAHIDSGKTTLTESILLKSSYLAASGTVDTGSTTTDYLPVERERGITVQSASIPVKWKDWTFNLIDTPGHADFGMEVESASRVVDGAVVLIDSVEGVEAQTRGVWRQLDRYGVGTRMIFLNKLDRPGASFKSSLKSLLKHRLHQNPIALTLPVASFNPQHYAEGEPGIQGLVDLVRWNVWKWDEEGQVSKYPLPRNITDLEKDSILPPSHPLSSHLVSARTQLLENLSMISESFMEILLNLPSDPSAYLQIDDDVVMKHLREASLGCHMLPVVCGAAAKHIGTELVMDYVGELLASPTDVSPQVWKSNTPVQLLAWKVNWDDKRGWMTFVRVYAGKLTRQTLLLNTNRNQKEKVSKLLLLYASEAKEVDELPFGSVGVILGLKYTRTGDTLVASGASESFRSTLRDITPPPAVISASVIPRSHADLQPVQNALESLTRTDPSLRVDIQEGQILVHGLGALHLEIVEGRLHDEWKVNFEFGRRYVSYREALGPREPSPNWNVWETDIGGKPVTLTAPLKIRALEPDEKGDPVWDGNIVIDEKGRPVPAPESMPGLPLTYAADGVLSALSNSPHSSLPMTRLHIQIGSLKNIGSKVPSLITGATATALRKRIRDAGFGPLLEPSVLLKISVGESNLGKVVKDLTERGGQLLDLEGGNSSNDGSEVEGYSEDGVYIPPDWLSPSGAPTSRVHSRGSHIKRSIQAIAPLSQFLDYSNRLRSLSEGHGTFEMSNAGFEEVNEERKLEILREIGRA